MSISPKSTHSTTIEQFKTHNVLAQTNLRNIHAVYKQLIAAIPDTLLGQEISIINTTIFSLCDKITALIDEGKDSFIFSQVPQKSSLTSLSPIRKYSVLDRLNLDPPLLCGPLLQSTSREEYLSAVAPKNSLECSARNSQLHVLISRINESTQYIKKPLRCLQNPSLQQFLSQQTITIPTHTVACMQHHLRYGSPKSQKMTEGGQSIISRAYIAQKPSILKSSTLTKPTHQLNLDHESALLMCLQNFTPHIVKPLALSDQGLFLQPADASLYAYLKKGLIKTPEDIQRMFLQVAQALQCMHQQGLTHSDVKLENILIDKGEVRLCDFGLTFFHDQSTFKGGTRQLFPPEYYVKSINYTTKVDSWNFGLALLEIMINSPVTVCFSPSSEEQTLGNYLSLYKCRHLGELLKGYRAHSKSFPQRDPHHLFHRIIHQCLQLNPEDRPNMDKIIELLQISSSVD
jgi:hypothetical protein